MPRLPQVPFEVVGEHAEEDVCPNTIVDAMVDGPDLDVDPLGAAEGMLHLGESLVVRGNGQAWLRRVNDRIRAPDPNR